MQHKASRNIGHDFAILQLVAFIPPAPPTLPTWTSCRSSLSIGVDEDHPARLLLQSKSTMPHPATVLGTWMAWDKQVVRAHSKVLGKSGYASGEPY